MYNISKIFTSGSNYLFHYFLKFLKRNTVIYIYISSLRWSQTTFLFLFIFLLFNLFNFLQVYFSFLIIIFLFFTILIMSNLLFINIILCLRYYFVQAIFTYTGPLSSENFFEVISCNIAFIISIEIMESKS